MCVGGGHVLMLLWIKNDLTQRCTDVTSQQLRFISRPIYGFIFLTNFSSWDRVCLFVIFWLIS